MPLDHAPHAGHREPALPACDRAVGVGPARRVTGRGAVLVSAVDR